MPPPGPGIRADDCPMPGVVVTQPYPWPDGPEAQSLAAAFCIKDKVAKDSFRANQLR